MHLSDSQITKDAEPCFVNFENFECSQKQVVFTENYDAYREFLNSFDKSFIIPGLNENFVPQGIAYSHQKKEFLISGYMSDDGCATIITVNHQNGLMTGEHQIIKQDGEKFLSHSGGIAVYGKNVYITDGYVLCCLKSDFLSSPKKDAVVYDEIMLPASASFLCVFDGYLWCGNFYHHSLRAKYDKKHTDGYLTTYRTAVIAYRLDSSNKCGIVYQNNSPKAAVPYLALFAPDDMQGLGIFANGEMLISCSYGRKVMSQLLYCKSPLKSHCDGKTYIGKYDIPYWTIDLRRIKKSVVAPPMSEGVCVTDNNAYVIFESAATKYISNSINPTDCVWNLDKNHIN